MMKITILGCSGSAGVPALGYGWSELDRSDPKNARSRPSVLLEENGFRLLIDAGPDVRLQLTARDIYQVDAVLYTHAHNDHIGGTPDLLGIVYASGKKLPLYAHQACADEICQRYNFVFDHQPGLAMNILPLETRCTIGPFTLDLFPMNHVITTTYGIRCRDFAYLTDFVTFDDKHMDDLRELAVLVIDANSLHPGQSSQHIHLEETLRLVEQLKPQRTVVTHLPGWQDYTRLAAMLPASAEPAYDGLQFSL